MELVTLCAIGAEHTLSAEIKHLGLKTTGNKKGRVYYSGDMAALYRSTLWLRCADKIFILLKRFRATDFDALFDDVKGIEWETYFHKNNKITIDKVRTHYSKLSSQHSVQSIAQKAIYDHLMSTWDMGTLPETGAEHFVRIYIENDDVEVLLDVTGDALYKRGYKIVSGAAPLRETVACVLLQKMTWRRRTPLIDPFCGSGTVALEAALYAYNIAPGLLRTFAFETLCNFDKMLYNRVRGDAIDAIRTDVTTNITGSDISENAVSGAKRNAARLKSMIDALLKDSGKTIKMPQFVCCDYKDSSYSDSCVICNPPYGERLGDEEQAKALYKDMGCLKDCDSLGVITTHKGFENDFGEKAKRVSALKAGSFDTYFYQYAYNK